MRLRICRVYVVALSLAWVSGFVLWVLTVFVAVRLVSASGAYIASKELNQFTGLFKPFYLMSTETFSSLMYLVGPQVGKKDTNFRTAVSADEDGGETFRYCFIGDKSCLLKIY
jgi:hypothetical protein